MKMWKVLYGILLCTAVLAMDITAGILALRAEATQNQGKHLRVWVFECKNPSNEEVYKLGLGAAVLLCIAHLMANLMGRCSFCTAAPSASKQCSLGWLILTWVALGVGLYFLITGLSSNNNDNSHSHSQFQLPSSCGFSHRYFFYIGGISCFVHAAISFAYYLTATAAQINLFP